MTRNNFFDDFISQSLHFCANPRSEKIVELPSTSDSMSTFNAKKTPFSQNSIPETSLIDQL